jgi:hypothetical protein
VRILEGRDFTDQDGQDVAILNESLARRLFPLGSAVGRFLDMGPESKLRVVGVVADHRMRPDPDLHLPMVWLTPWILHINQGCVLAEGRGGAGALRSRMREAFAAEKPGAEPMQLSTLEDHVLATLHQENQNLRLLGGLGLGSLVLACFGLWAALNLQVALRTREFGIRAALGADMVRLVGLVLKRGMGLLLAGLVLGGGLAWACGRLGAWRWPGLPPFAWTDLAAAALVLLASGLLACLIPALRAARIHPAEALRME